jgi:hypothetical protein
MKSGLGRKGKGKGKGARTETHMASASVHAEPLNVLFKRVQTNIISRMRNYSETDLLPHVAPQATVNRYWSIPASGERPDSSDLEADINLESLGPETGCDLTSQ